MSSNDPTLVDRGCQMLRDNEGFRQFPYIDRSQKMTIGYGRNLAKVGISPAEAEYLLRDDINAALEDLSSFPFWSNLSLTRQLALVDLRVNLGGEGLRGFTKFLARLDLGDYLGAAGELLDSRAAEQEPARIYRDAAMIRDGVQR